MVECYLVEETPCLLDTAIGNVRHKYNVKVGVQVTTLNDAVRSRLTNLHIEPFKFLLDDGA